MMSNRYNNWLRTLGAPEDPVASDTTSEWSAMSLLKAIYGRLAGIGDYESSTVAVGSPISLSTGAAANLTSVSLEAGDWDVSLVVHYIFAATTVPAYILASASSTSATRDQTADRESAWAFAGGGSPGANLGKQTLIVGPARFNLAVTTTVYGVAASVFTVSTCTAWGILRARRGPS